MQITVFFSICTNLFVCTLALTKVSLKSDRHSDRTSIEASGWLEWTWWHCM